MATVEGFGKKIFIPTTMNSLRRGRTVEARAEHQDIQTDLRNLNQN